MLNAGNGQTPVWSLRIPFTVLLCLLPNGLKCGEHQLARVLAIMCDCCYLRYLAFAVKNQVCLAECLRCFLFLERGTLVPAPSGFPPFLASAEKHKTTSTMGLLTSSNTLPLFRLKSIECATYNIVPNTQCPLLPRV